MKKVKSSKVYNAKKIFKFKSNKDLENYYNKMWEKDKYSGFIENGINLSKIYDKARKDTTLKFLSPKKEEIILDAGCGNGKFSLKLAKKAKFVYGIDISKNAFKKSKKKASKNLIFKQGELEKLPFKNKFIDKIVCIETLEHVISPKKVLKEFYRVLKPEGKLVITYPTKSLNEKIADFFMPEKKFIFAEHLTHYSFKELKEKIESSKFKITSKKGLFFYFPFLNGLRLNQFLTKIIIEFQRRITIGMFNQNGVALLVEKI